MKSTTVPLVVLCTFLGFNALPVPSLADEGPPYCPGRPDCNQNNEDDNCDASCSNSGIYCVDGQPVSATCNSGWFPNCGTSADCNDNDVPDECETEVWLHPCAADPAGTLICDMWGMDCRCEADWDLTSNWVDGDVPVCSETARVEHSNRFVGFCVGGDNDDDPCDSNADCPGQGEEGPAFCSFEEELRLLVPTTTIGALEFVTKDSAATTDTLTVAVYPDGAGTKTVTTGYLELDASAGEVTLRVGTNARIVTGN